MFNKLSIEDSLFIIDEREVERFITLANEHKMLFSIKESSSVNEKDSWGGIFNIWLLFLETEKMLYLDYSKKIIYSCNFYSAEILSKTYEIKKFFEFHKKTEYTAYLLSYYVGNELLTWTYDLLKQSPEGRALMKKNYNRDYFQLMNDNKIVTNTSHEHYKDQKLMTSLMAQSYSNTNDYNIHIKNGIRNTENHLNKQTFVNL